MNELTFFIFLQSIFIGLTLAAPVGPIGVLTIRRTLAYGRWTGFVSGLGTATADAVYGFIGTLGITALSGLLIRNQSILAIGGGLFLCYLGVQTLRASPTTHAAQARTMGGLLGIYLSAFLLTLTNPMTILAFGAILASLMPHSATSGTNTAIMVVLGVFIGSTLWWFLLSTFAALFRHRLNTHAQWINRISGVVIIIFGVLSLVAHV